VYTGLFCVRYRALLRVCKALMSLHSRISVYRTLLRVCRAILRVYRAVLSVCGALLRV